MRGSELTSAALSFLLLSCMQLDHAYQLPLQWSEVTEVNSSYWDVGRSDVIHVQTLAL